MGAWNVRLVEHLAPHFELLMFNHRGLGRSDETSDGYTIDQFAADAAGLAIALGYRRMHVLGYAIGGAEALILARDFPDLTITVTAAATSTGSPVSRREELVRRARDEIAELGYERYLSHHADNGEMAFSPGFYEPNRELAAALGQSLCVGRAREEVLLRHAEARATYRLDDWLRHLPVPTLVVVGGEDNVVRSRSTPLIAAHEIAGRLPNATLKVYPGARHMVLWEVPAEFTAALVEFVARHD
jgi:pimeloyl-ACP methyl ester carboxylesterase